MTRQLKILVVEDDYLQSYTLRIILESLNHKVLGIVDSGVQAIQMAKELHPDLILMDISLNEEMDGIEAAIKIQETADIPLIYISGNSSPLFRTKANQTNHRAFLTKPVTKTILAKALAKSFA